MSDKNEKERLAYSSNRIEITADEFEVCVTEYSDNGKDNVYITYHQLPEVIKALEVSMNAKSNGMVK